MASAFHKEVIRSITGSWGRFLAILGIVALGCGFYAGLRMTGPDMRLAADEFYDGTHLYDIRIISTLGLSDENMDTIAETDGVEAVMPTFSTDVMASLNGEQYAMRINSLPVDAASESTTNSNGSAVYSEDDGYLNRIVLEKGTWPTEEGQCVLSADRVMGTPIQVGDTVEVLYGSSDLDGVLDVRTYTVTGLAHSSSYVSSVGLGSTSLGSGTVQQYMYVVSGNFSDDLPYTEVNVRVSGAADQLSGSDAYQSTVDAVAQNLEDKSPTIATDRYEQLRSDAQTELDDATADYESEKADAQAQLDDAKAELDKAAQAIADSQEQIDSGQQQIDEGAQQLEDSRAEAADQLASAYDKLASTQSTLDDSASQISDGEAQLADAWSQYDDGLAAWQAESDTWDDTTKPGLQSQLAQAEQQRDYLKANQPPDPPYDPTTAEYQAWKSQLDQAKTGIAQLEAGIAQGDQTIADAKATLDETKSTLDGKQAELDASKSALADGQAQLAAGWDSYYEQKASAQAQLDEAQATLDDSQAELDAARDTLADGQREYDEGRATYEDNRREASEKFDDAATQLTEARKNIDDIEQPSIYVLDRTKNYGAASFTSDSERIDNIAAFFPFIFFLVAALVALTTMTRMVDEERELIGTYKALGYHKSRIISKYLVYAGLASTIGATIGILVLSQVLPYVICKAYAIIYNVPQRPLPLSIDVGLALLSACMGIGITLFATWAAAASTLRAQPAELMRQRAPKAGKRILLERVGPIWRRFSFSWKVTFRNIFRYRKRLWMTIIGIAGCTALLLTGFGLHDSIWDIIDKQFGPVVGYDVVVQLDDDAAESDIVAVESTIDVQGEAESSTRADSENMHAVSASSKDISVQVVIPQDISTFTGLLHMHERVSGKVIDFDSESVVLTEKLANELGLKVGDEFSLYDQDDVGNATGSGYALTVTGIMENYISDYVYVGSDAYSEALGHAPDYRSVYATVTTDADRRETLTGELHDLPHVQTVAYNDETIDSYRKMLSSVDMIVVVLVVAAAALAFIVLYNLTNINITERKREIASLKVLGFTTREVDAYIFREIALLTLLGAALGLFLGVFLEGFVITTAEVDYVMFGREIHIASFLISFALTVVFSTLVMLVMRRKLDAIDMVESLKSNE